MEDLVSKSPQGSQALGVVRSRLYTLRFVEHTRTIAAAVTVVSVINLVNRLSGTRPRGRFSIAVNTIVT